MDHRPGMPGPYTARPKRPSRFPRTPQQLADAVRLAVQPRTVHEIRRFGDHLMAMLEGYDGDPQDACDQIARQRGVRHAELVRDRVAIVRVWPVHAWTT